jgi:hypothetical protein
VFAAPLSAAGSLDKTSLEGFRSELSTKTDSHNDFDDLFADVQAVALTTEEAQAVEGDGWGLGLLFGTIGTIGGTLGFHYGAGYSWGTAFFTGFYSAGLLGFAIGMYL